MGKIDRHIEIVSSTTAGLSSMSKTSRDAVYRVLRKYYKRVGITIVNTSSDLDTLTAKSPDMVFLGMKFLLKNPGSGFADINKIWLAEFLSERSIATTGSQSFAHELEANKPLAKKYVLHAGLKTSEFYVATIDKPLIPQQINYSYPLFVKPTSCGGGRGINSDSIVYDFSQLKSKVDSIAKNLNSDSLIEKYLPGREFSVAILKNINDESYSVIPIELVAPTDEKGARLLSSKVKSADAEKVKVVTDKQIRKLLTDLAMNAFRSIGGRDYGRIDIRMDEFGVPHFLEANLIPSLIDRYGSFPKACALDLGLNYDEMLLRITNLGLTRSRSLDEAIVPILYSGAVLNKAYS